MAKESDQERRDRERSELLDSVQKRWAKRGEKLDRIKPDGKR